MEVAMRHPRFVKKEDVKKLELEVIPQELRVYLTRELDSLIINTKDEVDIVLRNRLINRARNIQCLPVYVLESDIWDGYQIVEYAWHIGEFEVMLRRLSTVQFIEFVCELISWGWFSASEINELFERDHLSFRINFEDEDLVVDVFPIGELETSAGETEHPNIRVLINRMDKAFEHNDYSGVLHASASVFETMAKDVVGTEAVQNQTLGGFIERYRKDSKLPSTMLDYIAQIYNKRNTTPLAGHGSTQTPDITKEEALELCEMTKAFVRIEYSLRAQLDISRNVDQQSFFPDLKRVT